MFDPWMSRIASDRRLHQITIPGTHDSATRGLLYPSECQTTTIEEQLTMGVRYFDIRLDASTSNLRIVHGSVHGSGNTNLYLIDVARMFCSFLTGQQPGAGQAVQETVIVQIKADRGDESGLHARILAVLRNAFASHLDRLYLTPIHRWDSASGSFAPVPTLRDLRGKLVLIRRYEHGSQNAPDSGTPVDTFASGRDFIRWNQNNNGQTWQQVFEAAKFEWPNSGDNLSYFGGTLYDYRNYHGLSFVIQDNYEQFGNFTAKFALTKLFCDLASQGSAPDSWFINFASCAPPSDYERGVNIPLATYFSNIPNPKPDCGFGTVLIDFAETELVQRIYQANF